MEDRLLATAGPAAGRRLIFNRASASRHPGQAFAQRKEQPRFYATMSAEAEEKKA